MRTLSIFLFLFPLSLFCQPDPAFTLKGEIAHFPRADMVYLISVEGTSLSVIDSVFSENGRFMFVSNEVPPTGLYQLFWDENDFLPLIIHHEKYIQIHADQLEPDYQVSVQVSEENKIFYFLREIESDIDSLSWLGDRYWEEGNHSALTLLKTEIENKVSDLKQAVDSIDRIRPGSFVIKMYRSSIPPDFNEWAENNPEHGFQSEAAFLKRHYFDPIDKKDSCLVRTTVIYDACSFYLRNLIDEPSNKGYIKACDFIISSFSWNNEQYEYVLNLMLNTFEGEGYEDVFLHLYDTYLSATSCEGGIPGEQERKAMSIRKLKPGSMAPDLRGTDRNGEAKSLADYQGKKVLVMFWASECAHCEEAIPAVIEILKSHPEVVFFSFSLDTNESLWVSSLLAHGLPDPSVTDLKGFDGEEAVRWFIWGTPSFFVIDESGLIVSKPLTSRSLKESL